MSDTTVRYFSNPTTTQQAEVFECETVGHWLVEYFGNKPRPQGLRIFKGEICETTDITDEVHLSPESLLETNGLYTVVILPKGGSIQAVLNVIVAVSVVRALRPEIPSLPTANVNRNQQSPNNSLSARQNTVRVNERFADIRGKDVSLADLLMVPYRKFIANREYEYIYACVSTGQVLVEELSDGITPFGAIPGAQVSVFNPNTSPNSGDSPVFNIGGNITDRVFDVSQSNEIDGNTLDAPNQVSTTPVQFTATRGGVISFPESSTLDFTTIASVNSTVTLTEFETFAANGQVNPPQGTPGNPVNVFLRQPLDGQYVVNAVTRTTLTVTIPVDRQAVWNNLSISGTVLPSMAYVNTLDSTQWFVTQPTEPWLTTQLVNFTPSVGLVESITIGPVQGLTNATQIWVNLVAQNGLYKDSGSSTVEETLEFDITINEQNSSGAATGVTDVTRATLTSNAIDMRDTAAITVEINVPYPNYSVEVIRITDTDRAFNGTVVDEVKWRELYFANNINQTDFGNVTTIHAVVRNTDAALRVKDRRVTCRATRFERVWNASTQTLTTATAASENFADAIVGLTLDPEVGKRTIADIDIANIYQVQAQVQAYFGGSVDAIKTGHTFDSTKISYEESISLIADACFCGVFQVGNRIKIYFRGPQMMSAALFNHSNKIPNTDARRRSFTREEDFDGVELTYRNIDQNLDITLRVPNNNIINPKPIELLGCPNNFIAIRRAYREWNNILYRNISYTFESFGMGRLLRPGQRIDNVNNTISGTTDGDIIAVDGLNIMTSGDLPFVAGNTYIILLQHSNGDVESIPVTQGILSNSAVLSRAPAQSLQADYDEARTKYIFGINSNRNASLFLIDSVESVITNGEERVVMNTINYDERYWQNDNSIPT